MSALSPRSSTSQGSSFGGTHAHVSSEAPSASAEPSTNWPSVNSSSRPGRGILRLFAFFVALVFLIFAVDAAIQRGLRRIKSSSYGVSNRVMDGQVNADIVISGSSRALTHYDCRIIRERTGHPTFNIGRNGSQTDMQLAFLKAYLRNNKKPSLVIHNLDMFSFVNSKEVYDPAQYFPYLNEPSIYEALRKIHPGAWKWRSLPLYAVAVEDMRFTWLTGLAGFLGWNPPETHFDGFLPRYARWTGDFEKYKASHPDGVRFEIEPAAVRDFEELLKICNEAGVPVLLVYSPVYHEMTTMERNRDEVFAQFRGIGRKYGAEVWDFSGSAISLRRELFYNSQHLNADGAAAFSTELASRLASDPAVQHILRVNQAK